MATYEIKVKVSYMYEVEAEDDVEAEKEGWKYEDYNQFAQVDSIRFEMIEEDEDEYEGEEEE
jgi:hypothetical protein